MKNNFLEIIAQHTEIKAHYFEAKAMNDKAGMEQARAEHDALEKYIDAQGETYSSLFRLYHASKEVGNEYIDISECYEYHDEASFIAGLREYGIDSFTFSSGWSSAVKSAWAFLQNGCELVGMVEINSRKKYHNSEEYEKIPAYLFKVQ